MISPADKIKDDPGYSHLCTLAYDDLGPFIIEHLKKHSLITLLTWILTVSSALFLLYFRIQLSTYSILQLLPYTLAGLVAVPLLLIIPHELLHILPYLLFGAKNIKAGISKQLYYIYVSAHHFPLSAPRFIIIAIIPFVMINSLLICTLPLLSPPWQWTFLLALTVHITMCYGDIALINYYYLNRDKKIVTWDDTIRKEAYFYEKKY